MSGVSTSNISHHQLQYALINGIYIYVYVYIYMYTHTYIYIPMSGVSTYCYRYCFNGKIFSSKSYAHISFT